MKRIILINISIFLLALVSLHAQDEVAKMKTEVSGSIWYQYYYDTYQSVETRDGILLLYPKALDSAKVNETGKIGSSAFFSRFRAKFSGGEAFGAKASGMIEGDFFATSQGFVGHLRLRHAFIKLNWEKATLLTGQYWHPIVDTDVIPASLLVANVPYFPLNRSPQINFNYNLSSELSVTGAALMQAYHRTSGPIDMQRNAGVPELALKLKYKSDNFVIGANGGVKTVRPRIETALGAPTTKKLSTTYFGAFTKVTTSPVTFKGQLVYGSNLTHFIMIGGMGAQENLATEDDYDYTALKTLSSWADIYTNNKKIQLGVFFGYSKLMGASDNYLPLSVDGVALTRTANLAGTARIAPRIVFISNKMKIGFEYILTSATYGKAWDAKYVVTEKEDAVFSSRILLTAKYDF